MVPRQIDIREALPTGANGKVDRRALREATNEASA
jgi:acyl-coenzyme A synthetase/AMP-(fatty) acid ligase